MTASIDTMTTNNAVAMVRIASQGNWRAIPTIARMPMAAWKSDSFILSPSLSPLMFTTTLYGVEWAVVKAKLTLIVLLRVYPYF